MLSLEQFLRPILRISSPLVDRTLIRLSFNKKINRLLRKKETRKLHQIDRLKKILIVPDVNIGDALIGQSFISPLKNTIPDVEISYIYQRRA